MKGGRAASWRFAAALLAASVAGLAACGSSGGGAASSAGSSGAGAAARQPVFVVLGDVASAPVSDTIPVGESWPQLFFRNALSRNTVFVNLAARIAPAHLALRIEMPIAQRLHPTIAGVLLGFADVAEQEPTTDFEESLDALVSQLRSAGAQTILLATLPGKLPGVAPYNQVITDVARRDGAVLVDLTALPITYLREQDDVTPVPDRTSQHAIARAFVNAYKAQ